MTQNLSDLPNVPQLNSGRARTWISLWLKTNAPPLLVSSELYWNALSLQPQAGLASWACDPCISQGWALRWATHLIYCTSVAVLKFLIFFFKTRSPTFSFYTGACKLRNRPCLEVKGAVPGSWSSMNLEKVYSCSSVFRVSASALTTNAPLICKEISASLNPQLLPRKTLWKEALFSKYLLTETLLNKSWANMTVLFSFDRYCLIIWRGQMIQRCFTSLGVFYFLS